MAGLALREAGAVLAPGRRTGAAGGCANAAAAIPRTYRFDRLTRLGRGIEKPVFAVVHSNGAFFPLGQQIGAAHRFLALQAADRRSGGRLPGTVAEIAAGYVRQLLEAEPAGPYVLLGWCLAGNIAYEAAQQLRAAGHAVAAIVLVDTWNPAYTAGMGSARRWLTERCYGAQVVLQDLAAVRQGKLSLSACIRQRNTMRRLLGPAAMQLPPGPAADAYRADRAFDEELSAQLKAAARAYRPLPWDGRVLHIRSAAEPAGYGLDRSFGWRGLFKAETVTVPGDHYTIFLEPAVRMLGHFITDALGLHIA